MAWGAVYSRINFLAAARDLLDVRENILFYGPESNQLFIS
jgi:hypothetical protein